MSKSSSVCGGGASCLLVLGVIKAPGGYAGVVIATANWCSSWRRLLGGQKGKFSMGVATV